MSHYNETPEGDEECPNCLGSCYEVEPVTLCAECENTRSECKKCQSKGLHIIEHGTWCKVCGGHGLVTESQARDYRSEKYADFNM